MVVRSDLGENAFTKAWEEGQAMLLEQAIAAALQMQKQYIPPPESHAAFTSTTISQAGESRTNPFGLTAREIEVLQLVSLGLTDAQIAERLVISPRTVEAHVRSVLNKLGVNSRTSATRSAIAHNLVSLDIDQEPIR
jgi:DNA-binding NarL/FixJ family response regulator